MKTQLIFVLVGLVALCSLRSLDAAPADSETTQKPQETTTTPAAPSDQPASTEAPAITTTAVATPSSETTAPEIGKPVDQAPAQPLAGNLTTTFTCYGRPVGYYADLEQSCRVYHFCLLGDYNNERVYQRITYLCMHDTVFDQQSLDCLEPSKITSPCKDAPSHYGTSNDILRKAIIESKMQQDTNAQLPTAAPTTPAASS